MSRVVDGPLGVCLWALVVLWGYVVVAEGMLSYSIRTFAGTGSGGYSGDDGPATSALLNTPWGLCDDTAGNVYIGDGGNNIVRKIAADTGIITTFAGSGSMGFAGDGLPATDKSVMLNYPMGVWMSSVNVLYIADRGNHRIRSVNSSGIISTFAGTGNTAMSLNNPCSIMGTTSGVIYIADTSNNLIRAVDASGIMTVIAGNGGTAVADNVAPTSSGLYSPLGLWILTNGDYYIADTYHDRIRKVSHNIITTVAGGGASFADNVQATSSSLSHPAGVWVSSVDGSIYIADSGNYRIRVVDGVSGIITTIAGTGVKAQGTDSIAATSSTLMSLATVYGRTFTTLYAVDQTANKIRLLTLNSFPSGQPTSHPSDQPSRQPSNRPTCEPSGQPTAEPISRPSEQPTGQPTGRPSRQSSEQPTGQPTGRPSVQPSVRPVGQPTVRPLGQPTSQPTSQPSVRPSSQPTAQPGTSQPTSDPTSQPSRQPTSFPIMHPTCLPISLPTSPPTCEPTCQPSDSSTQQPTSLPTAQPTCQPTYQQKAKQTTPPTSRSSVCPTAIPTCRPTCQPSGGPTSHPTSLPTAQPTCQPTCQPKVEPTTSPTSRPCVCPTSMPTCRPTCQPSRGPTQQPTSLPTAQPTVCPTHSPSCEPTKLPSSQPTQYPSSQPTSQPAETSSTHPTSQPTIQPTRRSILSPYCSPTVVPSDIATHQPTSKPSLAPSPQPVTYHPSQSPSLVPTHNATLASDPNTQPVVVVLTAPSDLGLCIDLTVDWAASTGHLGTRWHSSSAVSLHCQSINDTSHILSFALPAESFLIVNASRLRQWTECEVNVTLCRGWRDCAWAVKSVTIRDTPTGAVVMSGAAERVLPGRQALSIAVSASLPASCQAQAFSNVSLEYQWSILDRSLAMALEMESVSPNPSLFVLSPYSLLAGHEYVVTVSVRSLIDREVVLSTVSAMTVIRVLKGVVVPVVTGGLQRSVRNGSTLVIDARDSYDEDAMYVTPVTSLRSSLSCLEDGLSCRQALTVQTFPESALVHTVTGRRANSSESHVLTLTVYSNCTADNANCRHANVSLFIVVVPVASPVVSLVVTQSPAVMNPSGRHAVTGFAEIAANASLVAEWALVHRTLGRVDITRFQSSQLQLPMKSLSALRRFDLLVDASALMAGQAYTLRLVVQASPGGVTTSTPMNIWINGPPLSGTLSVSPMRGRALETPFTLQCSYWEDEHLPLTYRFGFRSATGNRQEMQSQSEFATSVTTLPAGDERAAYALTVEASVFDSLGAASDVVQRTTVYWNSSRSSLESAAQLLSVSADWLSVQQLKRSVTLSLAVLNRVDCSQSPNCTLFHREDCAGVANTCGDCLTGFVGVRGDANAVCLSLDQSLDALESLSLIKRCPNDCSGQGMCVSGANQSSIAVFIGEPVCRCDASHYGDDCSLSWSDWYTRQQLRRELVHRMTSLVDLYVDSESSRTGMLSDLLEVTQQPSELSLSAVRQLLPLASLVLSSANLESGGVDVFNRLITCVQRSVQTKVSESSTSLVDMTLTQLDSLMSVIRDNVLPSPETQWEVSLQSLRIVARSVAPAIGEIQPIVLQSPRLSIERRRGLVPTQLQLNVTGSGASSFVSMQQLPLSLLSNHSSSLAAVRVSGSPIALCHSPKQECQTTISFPFMINNSMAQPWTSSYQPNVNQTTQRIHCVNGLPQTILVECKGTGEPFHPVYCNGSASIFDIQCGISHTVPECVLSGTSERCSTVLVSNNTLTCDCRWKPMTTTRRLTESNATLISVNFVALASTVSSSFLATVRTADDLSLSTLGHSWAVVVTLSALVGLTVVGMWLSIRWDSWDSPEQVALSSKHKGEKGSSLMRRKSSLSQSLSALSALALPTALITPNGMERVTVAMKQHHRWIALVFHYSHELARHLRLLSLITNVVLMLFVQSLTYALSQGDDGSCRLRQSAETCLSLPSAYETGQSKCRWDVSLHSCEYVQPANRMKVVVFVALFCAIVTTPLAMVNEWILLSIAAAPSIEISSRAAKSMPHAIVPMANALGDFTFNHSRAGQRIEEQRLKDEEKDWLEFASSLQRYWLSLSLEARVEFNALWGLDQNGQFVQGPTRSWLLSLFESTPASHVGDRVRRDMAVSREKADREWWWLQSSKASEQVKSRRVMLQFQQDLMAGLSEQLLENQDHRNERRQHPRSRSLKLLCWLWLLTQNACMLFYVFLFGLTKDADHQRAWAKSFAVWIVLEVAVCASVMVLVYHVLLPMLMMKDLSVVRGKVLDAVAQFNGQRTKLDTQRSVPLANTFNAAKYLFVSHRLAVYCAELPVSRMILHYCSPWPRQSYLHAAQSVSASYRKRYAAVYTAASQIALFFLMGVLSCPVPVQNWLAEISGTVVMGYVMIAHLELYAVYPLLVLIPSLFAAVIVYVMVKGCGRTSTSHRVNLQWNRTQESLAVEPIEHPPNGAVEKVSEGETKGDENGDGASDNRDAPPLHVNRRASLQQGVRVLQRAIEVVSVRDERAVEVDLSDTVSFNPDSLIFSDSDENAVDNAHSLYSSESSLSSSVTDELVVSSFESV